MKLKAQSEVEEEEFDDGMYEQSYMTSSRGKQHTPVSSNFSSRSL